MMGRGSRIGADRRGQSLLEYAVLVGAVVTVLAGMQTYLRRGLQARIADAGVRDAIPGTTTVPQYEPYYALSSNGILGVKTTGNYVITPGGVTGEGKVVAKTLCDSSGCGSQTTGGAP